MAQQQEYPFHIKQALTEASKQIVERAFSAREELGEGLFLVTIEKKGAWHNSVEVSYVAMTEAQRLPEMRDLLKDAGPIDPTKEATVVLQDFTKGCEHYVLTAPLG